MGLKQKGILALADDLVAHQERYNQNTFGGKEACGTVCCLAGFCYLAKVGARKFNRWAKSVSSEPGMSPRGAINAGREQLGIDTENPILFDQLYSWPDDLYNEYYANGPKGRVIVALKALQRLLPNGTIDENPKAVHTRIPQLKALLATQKKAAKK